METDRITFVSRFKSFITKYYLLMILCVSILGGLHKNHHRGNEHTIWSDQEGYYLYLPAVFIYDGFKGIPFKNCCGFTEEGNVANKYTYGVSLLELPFFLIIHGYATITGSENNGFGGPYTYVLVFASVFYLTLGVFFLRKFLLRYFPPFVASVSILLTFFGTNLFYYAIYEPGMSHVYSFFLFSTFLLVLSKTLDSPSLLNFCLLGLIYGLICVIRPTNIIIGLFLIFFEATSWAAVKKRVSFYLNHWTGVLVAGIIIFIVAIPQMLYWKHVYGGYIAYSYGGGVIKTNLDKEGFIYWSNPKILQVLFSYQNGLFMYTPLALISVGSSIWLTFKKQLNGLLILITFLIATYIFSSWWAWWFGGAFGHRCFVEYYALLSIPLAYFIHRADNTTNQKLKKIIFIVLTLLVISSIRLADIYTSPWDGPTWTFNRFIQDAWLKAFWLHR